MLYYFMAEVEATYFPKTVHDWNSLPTSAIEAHTVNIFCNQLSLFLIVNNYCNVL